MRNQANKANLFRKRILRASRNNFSRIILALDLHGASSTKLLRNGEMMVDRTAGYLCAVKMGRQTVLSLGPDATKRLIKNAHVNDLQCIIDDKLNDIDETNREISSAYFGMGFDGIIVNPIAGWKGGLEPVFKTAHSEGRGVIAVVYMSHPGAAESYSQFVSNSHSKPRRQYEVFAERAEAWGADGVVVGATRPDIVRKVRSGLSDGIHIYSPGIGTQGGRVNQACKAGSDFLIIGRSITGAPDPERAAIIFARQSMSEFS